MGGGVNVVAALHPAALRQEDTCVTVLCTERVEEDGAHIGFSEPLVGSVTMKQKAPAVFTSSARKIYLSSSKK